MKFGPLILSIVAVTLFLVGCMSMPISTMYKMSQLSVLGLSPSEIRVAIRTNELVEVQNGAAHIRLATKTNGIVGESVNGAKGKNLPAFDDVYKFHIQAFSGSEADISPLLLKGMEENERVTILKLSNTDAITMSEALARVKRYKAQGVAVNGGFSIGTSNNCFSHLDNFDELEVDLFLQTDVKDGFMLFLDNIDIIEEMRELDIELKTTNKCLSN